MSYKCHRCPKVCETSWMVLKNDGLFESKEGERTPQFLHYCSYMCHVGDRPNLPQSIWAFVQNKTDFNKDPNPVTLVQKKKEFQYLTYDEIHRLNDVDKEEYYRQKDNQLDGAKKELYDEMEQEDERTDQAYGYVSDEYDDY